jgi:hypothetical protein
MDSVEQPEHPRNYAAQQAPRCQHIRYNGERCAAPALRGQTICHFHQRAADPETYEERSLPPFIEDATSLQVVLMWVIRRLRTGGFHLMDELEYKRATLLLYGLQIANSNLKNFAAEHPRPVAPGRRQEIAKLKEEIMEAIRRCNEKLAQTLLDKLTEDAYGDPDQLLPSLPSGEDYYAVEERKQRPDTAAVPEASAG